MIFKVQTKPKEEKLYKLTDAERKRLDEIEAEATRVPVERENDCEDH